MNSSAVLVSALCTLAVSSLAQAPTALIQGSVTAEDGSSLPRALISYRRIVRLVGPAARACPAPGEAIATGTSAASNGTFALTNLPAGDYVLCAEVSDEPYLNPCKWSSSLKLNLASGSVQRPTLTLKRGVFLKVRVNDPSGLLPAVKNDPSRAPNLIVGVVFGNGAFLAAPVKNADQTGRDYQIAVPAGAPLKLWVFSRHVTLTDSKGAAVDNSGGRIPFQATSGQDQIITLNVAGRDPRALTEK